MSRPKDDPGPLTLEQVVAQLVDEFFDPRDWPADHRCSKEGPARCTHERFARRALLVRAAHLMPPSSAVLRDPDAKPRGRGTGGSPAPWSAAPAHLVDEAHRGAVKFDRELRQALDLGPLHVFRGVASRRRVAALCEAATALAASGVDATCIHASCQPIRKSITTPAAETPVDIAGVAALRGLPLLVELLKERDATHPLVAGPLVDPDRPERGRTWGQVERAVRHWHREARTLTGHVEKPVILRERVNPFAGQDWEGPSCPDGWSCGHLSCRLLFLAPRPAWEPARCPHCGTAGFPWDQETGVLRCDHPRCRDGEGRRPSWSMDAFMAPITELVDALEQEAHR